MTIDLSNPSHIIMICVVLIVWGMTNIILGDQFEDGVRRPSEWMFVATWLIILVVMFFNLGRLVVIHWNP